jgi:hypothetical protein
MCILSNDDVRVAVLYDKAITLVHSIKEYDSNVLVRVEHKLKHELEVMEDLLFYDEEKEVLQSIIKLIQLMQQPEDERQLELFK